MPDGRPDLADRIGLRIEEAERLHLRDRLALRPAEAARALGVSERTLRGMLPELPHVRAGGVVLLPVDLLREWLRDRARSEDGELDRAVQQALRTVGG